MEKNKGGRPPKFKTPEELQKKVDEYFDGGMRVRNVVCRRGKDTWTEEMPVPTITGLVLFCGFCDRHSFYAYEKIEKFSHTIKRARSRIEREYEEMMQTSMPTGAIFALKNFGWRDEKQIVGDVGKTIVYVINDANTKKCGNNRIQIQTPLQSAADKG